MKEKDLEREYKTLVKKLGGVTYKWVSPGRRGIPDQITFIEGQTYAVELKTKIGRLHPLQKLTHRELAQNGVTVCIVYGEEGLQKIGG